MTLDAATRYAGFWRRAAASFIDSLLFGLVLAKTVVVLEDSAREPLPDLERELR